MTFLPALDGQAVIELARLRDDIGAAFSLDRLAQARRPIRLDRFTPENVVCRVNHFLVKPAGEDRIQVPDWFPLNARLFVDRCLTLCAQLGLDVLGRRGYLTIDTAAIPAGATQRQPGWHIDGMQGPEAPAPLPACYQFICANRLPTQFACHGFDLSGVDRLKHQVFRRLEIMADPKAASIEATPGFIWLMGAYHVHQALPAVDPVADRIFYRFYLSYLPITSARMTVNPVMAYDYRIHTTSGEIPAWLE